MVALVLIVGLAQAVTDPPAPMTFKNVYLRTQIQDKTRDVPCWLIYDATGLTIEAHVTSPPMVKMAPRRIAFSEIASAEFQPAHEKNVGSAILVSPFLLNSKEHWLVLKMKDGDYALIQLHRDNYNLAIAELEKRANLKVTLATIR